MKYLIIILALIANNALGLEHNRIVGGYLASYGQAPFMVSVRDSGYNHKCGGTLLSSRFILTAAHCAFYAQLSMACVGSNNLYSQTCYQLSNIYQYSVYNNATSENDILLLKTATDIAFKQYLVQNISVDSNYYESGLNQMTLFGWGQNQNGAVPVADLQYITYNLKDTNTCLANNSRGVQQYPYYTQSQLCALPSYQNQGFCFGDSGGGLVYNWKVVGVDSRLMQLPCGSGFPDIFTRTSYYASWISYVMRLYA